MKVKIERGPQEVEFEVGPEDGFLVTIDGAWVIGLDFQYMGEPVGGEIPEDPDDPTNTPKVVIGHWPNGEEWERLLVVPVSKLTEWKEQQ